MRGVCIKRGDYDTLQLAERVLHIAGDVVADWQRLNVDRLPTLCVGVTVALAQGGAPAHQEGRVSLSETPVLLQRRANTSSGWDRFLLLRD